MRASLKALSCLAVATAACVGSADTIARQATLADLTKASSSGFTRHNCNFVSLATDSSGSPMATLQFNGTYASFGQDLSSSEDWSAYNMVQALVTNKSSHSAHFKFIVQLTSDPNNYTNAYTGSFYLDAGESRTFIFTLNPDSAKPFGMEYLRPVLTASYSEVIAGYTPRNLKTIYHWRVSNQDSVSTTLAVSQLKLIRQALVFNGISDGYGQYTDRGWTTKVHTDTDFAVLKAAELTDLAAHPGTGETNGSKQLVSPVKSNGFWQVVKNSTGQMYLEHPNGKLFWSLGVSAVAEGDATPVADRASYYTSLPSQTGTYARAYMQRATPDGNQLCFSFNVKNLMTKYGSNYETPWETVVKQRLSSWGVNTLGIDCKDAFMDGSMPFTVIEDTNDFGTRLSTPHQLWGSMPDPYDSSFESYLTTKFAADLKTPMTHQDFMGVFVDNELSWGSTDSTNLYYNVPRGVLNAPSAQPAKTAFMNQLESTYKSSISSLNAAWGTSYASWSDFLSKRWLPSSFPTAMKNDMSKFLSSYATEYYSKVNNALIAVHCNALYLGSRYDDFTPEVVSAASKYCDVLTFNFYRTVDNINWDYLNSLSRPVIISELGYGTDARGTFGGPSTVFSFADRASDLSTLLTKAITQKNIVGVHWYSYADEPITGRWSDYENAGMGLVDVADNPYPETVAALRTFTKSMYTTRD